MACDDCQDVINAALESVADLLDSGDDWNTGDEIAEFIRSRIGTNPLAERAAEYARGIEFRVGQLAERDARIAELESLLAEAYADADDVLRPRISELERELSEQADTIVDGLAKRRELERELAEARKDAERYRWIQRNAEGFSFETPQWDWTGGASDQLNEAIDDAMLAEREKE